MPYSPERLLLSASTNGRNIVVSATTSPGTLIHTAVDGTDKIDEIYFFAVNAGTESVTLTLQWGSTSSDDEQPTIIEPAKGKYLVAPGSPLQNGLAVRAYASTTGSPVHICDGRVDRWS